MKPTRIRRLYFDNILLFVVQYVSAFIGRSSDTDKNTSRKNTYIQEINIKWIDKS